MQSLPLSDEARRLVTQLEALEQVPTDTGPTYHVAGIGSGFYFAYEQLRNAAAYREHHLLLRSAVERFLIRSVNWRGNHLVAGELVGELTQSGYLKNGTIPVAKISQIDVLLHQYAELCDQMAREQKIKRDMASDWLYQIASAQIEDILVPNRRLGVFMAFAYEHYLRTVDVPAPETGEDELIYPVALYCAVQRTIFKSDIATTRYYCLAAQLPHLKEHGLDNFVRTNILLDELYQAPLTNRLGRLINRYGAPIRVLREVAVEGGVTAETLADRSAMIAKIKRVTQQQYKLVHERLNSQIGKAILFIFITKTLLGVAVEVPYDLSVHGVIAWLPLGLNILFPLIYMVLISARITTPGRHNTDLVASYVDRILYPEAGTAVQYRSRKRVTSRSLQAAFNVVYVIGFTLSFGLLIWGLQQLHFNVVNGIIFFVFLSAVSFLGFRLRQSSRELSMLDERQGLLQTLADFLSTPFVRVGWWLSDRYAKLNLVTVLLDLAIEMPLKTTLRFITQWVGFIRDKQEEL
jgi:hypothetical protein